MGNREADTRALHQGDAGRLDVLREPSAQGVQGQGRDARRVHEGLFTKAWCALLGALQTYVRQAHTTGLVWNSAPGSAAPSSSVGTAPPPPPSGGAPPPPPPPMPSNLFDDVKKTSTPAGDSDKQALFAEINKGSAITAGLKKVTADMQTHKNPTLRQQATVPAKTAAKPAAGVAPKQEIVRPPKIELENGKQWNVEYFKDNKEIIVNVKDMKQTVYIFKCENSVIQVKGKCNSITLDGCKKTSVVFDSLLSQVELINCQSVQIQTLGPMPTLSIQKTDGCMVYLSKEAMQAEIITSKSSEMNILVPHGEDGEFVEYPVPEQFKTIFDLTKKKLETTVSDIV
uniref:Adenylyl cyclase-associated protein n=1 Tax=Steinernema glaseri TaxID=37863 RepID=A0A1I7YXM6_9BILA